MDWYVRAWQNWSDFGSRSMRIEYWMFALVNGVVAGFLGFLEGAAGWWSDRDESVLASIWTIMVFIPCVAVGVRRLHDTGRSGWWLLVGLIPILGQLIVLALMLLDSQPHQNAWGPDPKGRGRDTRADDPVDWHSR